MRFQSRVALWAQHDSERLCAGCLLFRQLPRLEVHLRCGLALPGALHGGLGPGRFGRPLREASPASRLGGGLHAGVFDGFADPGLRPGRRALQCDGDGRRAETPAQGVDLWRDPRGVFGGPSRLLCSRLFGRGLTLRRRHA